MRIGDMARMSLSNLWKRKVRTLLTVTGVVVGTCAIVVMISLGLGMQKTMQESLAQMGDLTLISIYNYQSNPDIEPLDDDMLDQIRKMEHVSVVTPSYSPENWGFCTIKSGKYQYDSTIIGVDMSALEALGYTVQEGELPKPNEQGNYDGIVLFSSESVMNFYNPKKRNTMGSYIMMGGDSTDQPEPPVNVLEDKIELVINKTEESNKKVPEYKVTCPGILVTDWSKNPSPYGVFMDVNYVRKLENEYKKLNGIKDDKNKKFAYQEVIVKVDDMKYVAEVEEAIQAMGYTQTNSMESIRKPLEEQSRQQQMIFGGLGAISLFVAALGITNTMIMSIYERTREIGVMKVLGCVVGNIRTMFLMEAGTIGFIGGVIGLGISYLISFLINSFGGGASGSIYDIGGMGIGGVSIIPWWLALGALVFATMVGLVSGFSPANRAVKISALTAIRQE
ncbi:MAG TPA: ABC transporter permease [Candidatus Merdivicinus intestinigallinarum]|nr:ABC transporter permease [Candidatus Merdivicinus intestinigallinarum]